MRTKAGILLLPFRRRRKAGIRPRRSRLPEIQPGRDWVDDWDSTARRLVAAAIAKVTDEGLEEARPLVGTLPIASVIAVAVRSFRRHGAVRGGAGRQESTAAVV